MHLFSGEAPPESAGMDEPAAVGTAGATSLVERLALLEAAVADLRREIELLKSRP
jgi:uncharacterized protein YceH (UPF0502 family)